MQGSEIWPGRTTNTLKNRSTADNRKTTLHSPLMTFKMSNKGVNTWKNWCRNDFHSEIASKLNSKL